MSSELDSMSFKYVVVWEKLWTTGSVGNGSSKRELCSHSGHVEHCRPVRRDAARAGI